ncbi:hypothetical protein BLOT_003277 [Blomia tropicalis]|nr:hypothetical protein BLOT_003277 [Blomia tropicalis]
MNADEANCFAKLDYQKTVVKHIVKKLEDAKLEGSKIKHLTLLEYKRKLEMAKKVIDELSFKVKNPEEHIILLEQICDSIEFIYDEMGFDVNKYIENEFHQDLIEVSNSKSSDNLIKTKDNETNKDEQLLKHDVVKWEQYSDEQYKKLFNDHNLNPGMKNLNLNKKRPENKKLIVNANQESIPNKLVQNSNTIVNKDNGNANQPSMPKNLVQNSNTIVNKDNGNANQPSMPKNLVQNCNTIMNKTNGNKNQTSMPNNLVQNGNAIVNKDDGNVGDKNNPNKNYSLSPILNLTANAFKKNLPKQQRKGNNTNNKNNNNYKNSNQPMGQRQQMSPSFDGTHTSSEYAPNIQSHNNKNFNGNKQKGQAGNNSRRSFGDALPPPTNQYHNQCNNSTDRVFSNSNMQRNGHQNFQRGNSFSGNQN